MTVWLVRAGENSRLARQFADNGLIAVGWNGREGLDDWKTMDAQKILQLLRASGRIAAPEADLAEILHYRDDMVIGDLVVTPDATTREVLIGVVLGPDEYHLESPALDYHHVRPVRWFGRWDRDLLSVEMFNETKWRRTIRRLDLHADQWTALGARLRSGEGRPPDARGRPRSARARAGSKTTTSPIRTCPMCGYQLSTAMFIGGSDMCRDCQG